MAQPQDPRAIEQAMHRSEIQALIHRYAIRSREKLDWNALSQTLHPDAHFHLPNGATIGMTEWKQAVQDPQMAKYIRHHITTLDVELHDDAKATATAQFFVITDWSACDHWGDWRFEITRDGDGAWLISEMFIVLDGTDPKGWAAARYKHGDAGAE